MRRKPCTGLIALAALLTSCGGGSDGGGSGGGTAIVPAPTPTPSPTPVVTGGCALGARQDWVLAKMNEWYLFPETLPAALDKSQYSTLTDYLDALTAGARAQNKDRHFTYVTSASEETAFDSAGATAGLGLRLYFDPSDRLIVQEAFEGAPGLAAGIDRGTEILAVGSSRATLQTITDMIARQSYAVLDQAFGDSLPGTQVVLRIASGGGSREVTLTKANYTFAPLSTRYGYKVISEAGRKIGYLNLRAFITAANDDLRTAFGFFKGQGVTDMIVDLRYNGGGALDTAQTLTNLLGGARSTSDVQAYYSFRPSKSANDETLNFAAEAQAIAPGRIAFIGTRDTASASEYVMNAMLPYFRASTALIGSNTYGKPVGQIGLDNPSCSDDRLRVVALKFDNSARQGDYFFGLWSSFDRRCAAADDVTHAMGDPQEASTRAALDFIEGNACTQSSTSPDARVAGMRDPVDGPLAAIRPDAARRLAPRLF